MVCLFAWFLFVFFNQKTAYEMRISDWSSDVCSSDLPLEAPPESPPRNELRLLGHHPLGGAFIASLSPALAEELDMPEVWSGVVITRVQRGTPANRVGFRARDIIVSVNGQAFRRRSEEHTSELQYLMRNSYAGFCLQQNNEHPT